MARVVELRHGPVVPQVESLLRERLRTGYWRPGDRLPNEVRLAADLGVGRSSVREAVRLLAREGLLDVRHGSGTFVATATPEPDDVRRLLRGARPDEVHEVRRALEVEAARLAAQRARPEDLDRLREGLHRRQERHPDDAAVDADLEFHRAIVEASGNALLLSLFTAAQPLLRETLLDMVRHETDLPDFSCTHADLLSALEKGDPEAAVTAITATLEPGLGRTPTAR
ncbi:FadR/GntR family transcriptional regulator [Actinoallomurus acaciae]|uniref:FadR/GntR family transcriptional regulator n=1 Tax=Actinoallomurus acaciae TaxID=502577 RepID=A0ABV5YGC3_9ACTN